jgi:hypothetical protein
MPYTRRRVDASDLWSEESEPVECYAPALWMREGSALLHPFRVSIIRHRFSVGGDSVRATAK